MHEQLFAAFNEDVEGLSALEAALDTVISTITRFPWPVMPLPSPPESI
ncbi:hypothetical protein ACBQ28_01825 [Pseudomonas lundensis]